MAEVRCSPQAEANLEAILEDLNAKNPSVADRYALAFEEKGKLLARFPEIGRSRPEILSHVRSALIVPHVLFYRVQGDDVQILPPDDRGVPRLTSGETPATTGSAVGGDVDPVQPNT